MMAEFDFGALRALAQRARSPSRDLALCEMLRDHDTQTLRRHGALDYLLEALCESTDRESFKRSHFELVHALRGGELYGAAREWMVDLRGYKCPSEQVLQQLIERSLREPLVHLVLDSTACGKAWLMRLLVMGDWSHLRWLSVKGCVLEGDLQDLFAHMPSDLVGFSIGANKGARAILAHVARCIVSPSLRWLSVSHVREDQHWDLLAEALRSRSAHLLGLDVSDCEGFDDLALDALIGTEACSNLLSFQCNRSSLSEHALTGLLWTLPPGRLERLGLGSFDEERTIHLDQQALLGLWEIPSLNALQAFHWSYSSRAVEWHAGHMHRENFLRDMGDALVARHSTLRSLRVEGISLREWSFLGVLGKERLRHLEELGLEALACGDHDLPETIQAALSTLDVRALHLDFHISDYRRVNSGALEIFVSKLMNHVRWSSIRELYLWSFERSEFRFHNLDKNLLGSLEYLRLGGWPTSNDLAPDWRWMGLVARFSGSKKLRRIEGQFRNWSVWSLEAMLMGTWHADVFAACHGSQPWRPTDGAMIG